MMYLLDNSRQEKAIAIATRLDETMRDKNVKVILFAFAIKQIIPMDCKEL